jgi:hypothetical protein
MKSSFPSESDYEQYVRALEFFCFARAKGHSYPADCRKFRVFEQANGAYLHAAERYPVNSAATTATDNMTAVVSTLGKAAMIAEFAINLKYPISGILLADIVSADEPDGTERARSRSVLRFHEARLLKNHTRRLALFEAREREWQRLAELVKEDNARIFKSHGEGWWAEEGFDKRVEEAAEATKDRDEKVERARKKMNEAGVVLCRVEWWITMMGTRADVFDVLKAEEEKKLAKEKKKTQKEKKKTEKEKKKAKKDEDEEMADS